jgi:hypothetical protein
MARAIAFFLWAFVAAMLIWIADVHVRAYIRRWHRRRWLRSRVDPHTFAGMQNARRQRAARVDDGLRVLPRQYRAERGRREA